MKHLRTVAVAALALAISACTTKENTNTTTTTPAPSNDFLKTYSLQGYVADATNGERLGGSDLKLYLVQGVSVRSPDRANFGNPTDPLLGEFAFANIPLDYYDTNKTFKIVAYKPGYQQFETEINHTAISSGAVGGTLDSVYNYIGNIYLFPVGERAPALTFTLSYNGKPVPNADVLLTPVPQLNDGTQNFPGSALPAASAFLESIPGRTNATGVVTFPGADLVLGGAYNVRVLPVDFTDTAGTVVPLARYFDGTTYVIGLSNVSQELRLSGANDLVQSNLYVTSVSTFPEGQISTPGALRITFSAPVTPHLGGTGFSGLLAGTATGVLGTPGATLTIINATTIELTPNFTTQLAAGDQGVTISYGDGTAFVTANDYPGFTFNVFDLFLRDSTTPVSAYSTVQIRGWATP